MWQWQFNACGCWWLHNSRASKIECIPRFTKKSWSGLQAICSSHDQLCYLTVNCSLTRTAQKGTCALTTPASFLLVTWASGVPHSSYSSQWTFVASCGGGFLGKVPSMSFSSVPLHYTYHSLSLLPWSLICSQTNTHAHTLTITRHFEIESVTH